MCLPEHSVDGALGDKFSANNSTKFRSYKDNHELSCLIFRWDDNYTPQTGSKPCSEMTDGGAATQLDSMQQF